MHPSRVGLGFIPTIPPHQELPSLDASYAPVKQRHRNTTDWDLAESADTHDGRNYPNDAGEDR